MTQKIVKLLKDFKKGSRTLDKTVSRLKDLPYKDIGFAKIDNHRSLRRGFPEVVFGKGKTPEQIIKISGHILSHDGILMVTRTDPRVFRRLKSRSDSDKAEMIFKDHWISGGKGLGTNAQYPFWVLITRPELLWRNPSWFIKLLS